MVSRHYAHGHNHYRPRVSEARTEEGDDWHPRLPRHGGTVYRHLLCWLYARQSIHADSGSDSIRLFLYWHHRVAERLTISAVGTSLDGAQGLAAWRYRHADCAGCGLSDYRRDDSSCDVVYMRSMTANKSLQATRDGRSSSASRFTSFGPACLVCVPKLFSRRRGE